MSIKDRIDAAIQNPHKCDCEKAVREEREANAALLRQEMQAAVNEAEPGPMKDILLAVQRAVSTWAGWIERGEHRK